MTIKIRQIWDAINNVLTNINIFLLMILLLGGKPKKDRKIPFVANIALLLILVSVLVYTIRSYSNSGHEPVRFSKDSIAANMGSVYTTTLN